MKAAQQPEPAAPAPIAAPTVPVTTNTAPAGNAPSGNTAAGTGATTENISGGSNLSTDTLTGSAKDSGLGSLTITTSATSHELQGLSLIPPPITIGGSGSSSGSGSGSGSGGSPRTRPRPRANSKGQLGALEPIQERRRGSSTALDSAASAALALSGIQRVASADNNYDHCEDSEYEEEDEDEEELNPKGGAVTIHTNSDDSLLSPATPHKDRAEEAAEQKNTSPLQAISASPVPAASAEGGVSVPSNLTAGLLSASHASTFTALNTEPLTTALESTHITPIAESTHNSGKESKEGGKAVAGSFKSVSFSATNQTLQSDNTIRNSSTRMEIKPAASACVSAVSGTSASELPNVSTNAGDLHQHQRLSSSNGGNSNGGNNVTGLVGGTEMEVVDQYDAAARSINANAATGKKNVF